MAGNLERLLADVVSIYLPPDAPARSLAEAAQAPYSGLTDPPPVSRDDERTIAAIMGTLLAVVAAAEGTGTADAPPPPILYGVLAGSELIMRWECVAGRGSEILGLLHGFTYLVAVFFLDREVALRKSDEVRALVEAAGFTPR